MTLRLKKHLVGEISLYISLLLVINASHKWFMIADPSTDLLKLYACMLQGNKIHKRGIDFLAVWWGIFQLKYV